MPSLLGREIFRAQLTAYKSSTFEDSVIFVHDVEHTLDRLHDFHRQLIAKIVLQEYSQEEAARLLGCASSCTRVSTWKPSTGSASFFSSAGF